MKDKEYVKAMRSIRESTDEFIKENAQTDDMTELFTLELYKYTYAHARVAVTQGVDLNTYMGACFSMYQEAGGVIEDDIVTTSHSVH